MMTAMTRFILTVLFAVIFAVPSFAAEKESAFDRVLRTGTIRCGYVISPPHMLKDPNTGNLSGIAHDAIEKMAENLQLKIDWAEEVGWSTMLEGLATHRYDVLCSSVWATSSRALRADALNPLDFAGVNVWTRPDDSRFSGELSTIDWSKIKIAMIDGHVSDIISRADFPSAQKMSLPDTAQISELFTAVADGKADVTFEENYIGYDFLHSNPGKVEKSNHGPPLRLFPTAFLIPQGEEKLKAMLNIAQAEIINSGYLDKIIDRYEVYPGSFYRVDDPYKTGIVQ